MHPWGEARGDDRGAEKGVSVMGGDSESECVVWGGCAFNTRVLSGRDCVLAPCSSEAPPIVHTPQVSRRVNRCLSLAAPERAIATIGVQKKHAIETTGEGRARS